jgi:hypothetical protein
MKSIRLPTFHDIFEGSQFVETEAFYRIQPKKHEAVYETCSDTLP